MNQLAILAAGSTCKNAWDLKTILLILIGGVVIGLLGKFIAPGSRDNIPLWLTVLCGIGGLLLGNVLYTMLGGSCETNGIDWLRHLTQIITAAVLVMIAAAITGRPRKRV